MRSESPNLEDLINRQRRRSICGESYDPERDNEPNIQNLDKPKSEKERNRLANILEQVWLTKKMDADQKDSIVNGLTLKSYKPGEVLFEIGEPSEKFYIVNSGMFEAYQFVEAVVEKQQSVVAEEVEEADEVGSIIKIIPVNASRDTKLVKKFEANDFFGEIALLYDAPRCSRILATKERNSDSTAYEIDRQLFRKLVIQKAYQKHKMFEDLVSKCSLFDHLPYKDKHKVINALTTKFYKDGDIIVAPNQQLQGMHFVIKGQIKVESIKITTSGNVEQVSSRDPQGKNQNLYKTKSSFKTLITSGQWMGELSLLLNAMPPGTQEGIKAMALGPTITGFLDSTDFEKILGKNSIQRNNTKYEDLIKVALNKSV